MNKITFRLFTIAAILIICIFVFPDSAFAAPGGKIAQAFFRNFWGQLLLGVLTIVFLPLIIYFFIREYLAVKRTISDLKKLAAISPDFDWLAVKERITDAFSHIHSAWRREDMQEASEWMTDWYWQNQQMAFLDNWERQGLINHCQVKKIKSIKPLFVRYTDNDGVFDGSRLVVLISADMEDYLSDRQTGRVVEGKKGFAEVDTVWTFVYEKGRWLVSIIEERDEWYSYAKLVNEVPTEINKTLEPVTK